MAKKPNHPPGSDLPAGLAQPAVRALVGAGYLRLEQLAQASEAEIAQLHGIGANALKLLREALAAHGLSFTDSAIESNERASISSPPGQTPEHDFPPTIGRPATGALLNVGYRRMEQLTGITEQELLKIHGVGPKAVRLLREELESRGLSFAQPATRK